MRLVLFTVAVLLGFVASAQSAEVYDSQKARFKVETIASGLDHPWGLARLPDGQLLVTERSGSLRVVLAKTGKLSPPVKGLPKIAVGGQGGLLDVVLDDGFAANQVIYFSYSEFGSGGAGTAVGTGKLQLGPAPRLSQFKRLFSMPHKSNRGQHFGSRIVIGRDGKLYITIGDRGKRLDAQNPFRHAGSVIRINKDGTIPQDNPFSDGKKGLPELWSIGHRNPQGATLHPATGQLWTVEHGARGGDEINVPQSGKNYGWPVISYGTHYSGAKIGQGTKKKGMEQPVYYWDPSIAPSGLTFYTGDQFAGWKGNLFVGALRDQMLVRLEVQGGKVTKEERLLQGRYGRIRDVRSFDDGGLWLLTDDPNGKILRLTPAG